jgi:hypothetical protein
MIKFMRKRLVRKLEPLAAQYLHRKRVRAVSLIARAYKRYRHRKDQLERLKKRNEHRRRLAIEEEKYLELEGSKNKSAKIIQRAWRRRKMRTMKDINYQLAVQMR